MEPVESPTDIGDAAVDVAVAVDLGELTIKVRDDVDVGEDDKAVEVE